MIATTIGRVLCQPAIRDRLFAIARRDPDFHLMSPDGSVVYMHRFWLFNRIGADYTRKYRFIPFSIRIHYVMSPDLDRHLHDHPYKAWLWIMKGGYDEVRVAPPTLDDPNWSRDNMVEHRRMPGDFVRLHQGQFHKITKLHQGGSMSLFVIGRYIGPWGFLVNGVKMLRSEYERRYKPKSPTACKAVQHSDQTLCEPCGLGWDTNDEHRPPCGKNPIQVNKAD